jgi:hypothetical protein
MMRTGKISETIIALVVCAGAAVSQEAADRRISFAEGRITVEVENVALSELLDALRPACGIAFVVSPDAAQQTVTADVRNAVLEDGLRKILRGQDFFLQYSGDVDRPVLKKVWIYSRGTAEEFQPAAREALQSTRGIDATLSDRDPAARLRAFHELLKRPDNEAQDALVGAVTREVDDSARASMVEALRGREALPAQLVARLMTDPLEQIRIIALESARSSTEARQLATTALNDSSPHIRQRAQEILDEMNESVEAKQ